MVINILSKTPLLIESYVNLRNRFLVELDTTPITVESTSKWIAEKKGEVICFMDDKEIIGAAIIRDTGELSVFASKKGLGDQLLYAAENTARSRGLSKIWAKILPWNEKSIKLFTRNKYGYDGNKYSKDLYVVSSLTSCYPKMIVLSITYVCNAACPVCPYNNSAIRSTYRDALWMPANIYKRIVDESGPYGTVLRFSGGGEPMLHPEIVQMVSYARDKGCKVSIITNGSCSVEAVVDLADMIEFSVDAGTTEEYAGIRVGLNWDKLNKNVRTALQLRKTTKIIASIVNQHGVDIKRAEEYWGFLDAVQIRKYLTWGYNENRSADISPYLDPEKHVPCPWIFERINIDTRGDVTYCGEDIAFTHKFGNISERNIGDIWTGEEFNTLRKAHLTRKNYPRMCEQCPDWKYRTWDYNYWRLRQNAGSNTSA